MKSNFKPFVYLFGLIPVRPGKYFTWNDVVFSSTAFRAGLMIGQVMISLKHCFAAVNLGYNCLDQIREITGYPIFITSWYRSPRLNNYMNQNDNSGEVVNAAKRSTHMDGGTADFYQKIDGKRNNTFAAVAIRKRAVNFTRVIFEGGTIANPRIIHIEYYPGKEKKNEILFTQNGSSYQRVTFI